MRGAYERPPVDRRVRKRLRAGSGGTPTSGRTGRAAGSMVLQYELPVQILRLFRPELALSSGKTCDLGAKKAPMPVREVAETFSAKIGTDILTFLFMFSALVLVGTLCQCFRLWIVLTIGTDIGTFFASKRTFLDGRATRIRRFVPDTPRYGRAPKNR